MENSISTYSFSNKILDKYKQQSVDADFKRILDGSYEMVDYLPNSSIRFWVNTQPMDYHTHWHPAVELIMPLENTYTAIVGQNTYHLHPGDIFIIPSGELHHLMAPPTGTRLIYLFDFSVLSKIKGFSFLTPYLSHPVLINKDNCGPIYDEEAGLILKMCDDYYSGSHLRELMVYSHLLKFFSLFGNHFLNQDDDSIYSRSSSGKQKDLMFKLNKVFEYLDSHYMEEITLEKAADIAGFSKFYFSRLFKQCSEYNFYDYLCYRRIKSAEELLLDPKFTITEIALQSGFSSLSTFNRTFKRFKNCTPSEYRSFYHKNLHSL